MWSNSQEEQLKAETDRSSAIVKKATERQQKLEARIEEEMMEWLERHRLLRHAKTFIEVVGTCVALLSVCHAVLSR